MELRDDAGRVRVSSNYTESAQLAQQPPGSPYMIWGHTEIGGTGHMTRPFLLTEKGDTLADWRPKTYHCRPPTNIRGNL